MITQEDRIVLPGDVLSIEKGYLRGHGTFVVENDISSYDSQFNLTMEVEDDSENEEEISTQKKMIVSSVGGVVKKINKLIQVNPIKSRYRGEVGDVVIGRIVEVEQKRWKVDLNASSFGILHLGAINLPGGALRRRTAEDSFNMRKYFEEKDLISAEISKTFSDGRLAIHTRSLRYGKLENGCLIQVSSALIVRAKNHFISFSKNINIDAIIGLNGHIWLTIRDRLVKNDRDTVEDTKMINKMEEKKKSHAARIFSKEERLLLARVRNCIVYMNYKSLYITQKSIEELVLETIRKNVEPKNILSSSFKLEFE